MGFRQLREIEVYRGESKTLSLTFTSGGSAYDISGGTILFTVKDTLDTDATDATAILTKTGTIISGVGGTASVSISTSDSSNNKGEYYYDVKYINGGTTFVLGVGSFRIGYPVTNRTS